MHHKLEQTLSSRVLCQISAHVRNPKCAKCKQRRARANEEAFLDCTSSYAWHQFVSWLRASFVGREGGEPCCLSLIKARRFWRRTLPDSFVVHHWCNSCCPASRSESLMTLTITLVVWGDLSCSHEESLYTCRLAFHGLEVDLLKSILVSIMWHVLNDAVKVSTITSVIISS